MTFILIDKNLGLYRSTERVSSEPEFPSAFFKKLKNGWYFEQSNENYFRYDALLERVLMVHHERRLPLELTDDNLIQFSKMKTIY